MKKLAYALSLLFLIAASGCFDPAKVVITNELTDRNIVSIHVSSSSEEDWGENTLPDWKSLQPGESEEITVLPDSYDIKLIDDRGDSYTIWDLEISEDDFNWNVNSEDAD